MLPPLGTQRSHKPEPTAAHEAHCGGKTASKILRNTLAFHDERG